MHNMFVIAILGTGGTRSYYYLLYQVVIRPLCLDALVCARLCVRCQPKRLAIIQTIESGRIKKHQHAFISTTLFDNHMSLTYDAMHELL